MEISPPRIASVNDMVLSQYMSMPFLTKYEWGFNIYRNQQISVASAVYAGFALAGKTYRLTVVDSLRYGHLIFFVSLDKSRSAACGAGFLDYLTGSVAGRACSCRLHGSENRLLNDPLLTRTVTLAACLGMGSGFRSRSVAGVAGIGNIYLNILFAAENSFLKGYLYCYVDVTASHGAVSSGGSSSAEAEHAEYVSHIEVRSAVESSGSAAHALLKGRMAELIVLSPLLGIAQHLICLVDFLELLLGGLVSGISVRMIFFCQFTICFFYFIFIGALLTPRTS